MKLKKKSFLQKMVSYIDILIGFFLKKSFDFWNRKWTLKVRFQHFLTNHHCSICFKEIFFRACLSCILGPTISKIPQLNWHWECPGAVLGLSWCDHWAVISLKVKGHWAVVYLKVTGQSPDSHHRVIVISRLPNL